MQLIKEANRLKEFQVVICLDISKLETLEGEASPSTNNGIPSGIPQGSSLDKIIDVLDELIKELGFLNLEDNHSKCATIIFNN